ncbi:MULTISPECIES: PAQR family membrane homeostasis protein TrhA [Sutcliffiella]|uniref:Hemolysin n=1 Tax=Sutcliffiella cohnii TaxID=33932 RepID=A0A223KK34_9BACI|nr:MULTISPECIES: hemolysin III family protein [Sutcliffiella]AST89850.1 hemolysin [Sutcliffiella cohnii]WBL15477.1 hemolysin III family protein [Sutcliffiella sp. NC1]
MNIYVREPINTYTHLVGAVLSFIGLLAMVIKVASNNGSPLQLFTVILFGLSLIFLYSASTIYHLVQSNAKVIASLRRIDHSMIFILIAGTYTPFCLISLSGTTGWIMFTIIVGLAICGVLFKLVWFNCPRWLSTSIYIAMGWIIITVASPLASALGTKGMILLVTGGLIYTVGGIIYAVKPSFLSFKNWGFHEIFHLYILLGSFAHFLCVYFYVI